MNREDVNRLAVLHLITRLERGGSSDCTLWQAIGAARRGHRVTVASGPTAAPSPLLEQARRQAGLTLVTLPLLSRDFGPRQDLLSLLAIMSLLRRERFDVLHLHTSKAGALGRLAALLTGQTKRVIHQPHGHLFYGYYGNFGSALVLLSERCLAPLARLHVTLSRRGAEEHLSRGVGRPGQFRTVPSGVDFRALRAAHSRRAECRARLGCANDDFVIGTLCRLEPVKGANDLVRGFVAAAGANPRLRLLIGGDGPLRQPLMALLEGAGLSGRARLAGEWTSPETLLPALDLFVLASRNEGMGRALVEAMALGIPVVGTAVGGVPELLMEGEAGLLVDPEDPHALAAAMTRMSADPIFAAALGRRGRARATAYGAGRMIHSVLRLYREVAA